MFFQNASSTIVKTTIKKMLRRVLCATFQYTSRQRLIGIKNPQSSLSNPQLLNSSQLILPRRYVHRDQSFEFVSDETLESLCERLEILIDENPKLAEADITLSNGVLTLSLPKPHGTYVINKQSPNEQIWLSSPISGPKRYDLTETCWIYKHTNESLHSLLDRELSEILNQDPELKKCFLGGSVL